MAMTVSHMPVGRLCAAERWKMSYATECPAYQRMGELYRSDLGFPGCSVRTTGTEAPHLALGSSLWELAPLRASARRTSSQGGR